MDRDHLNKFIIHAALLRREHQGRPIITDIPDLGDAKCGMEHEGNSLKVRRQDLHAHFVCGEDFVFVGKQFNGEVMRQQFHRLPLKRIVG